MKTGALHRRDRFGKACSSWLPGERWERWTFGLLMVVAAILRFRDLPNIPFTHDELSALLRIYPTLGETIQKGVIEGDTHPPGVQVFEWFWTQAFGMSETSVKLPFILMGLAALFFLYRVASAWTNTTVALIVVALLATMQYSVMYAQIARPYAFGFFTCAWLLDRTTFYVATDRKGALVGFVFAEALSAYTHHFALMFGALVAICGFALLRRDQRISYVFACGAAAVLYLPNIPILLHQFAAGGLDAWLVPPGPHWLRDYAAWIVMYSWPLTIALIALVAWSTWNALRMRRWREPLPWLLLFLGIAPLAIGYAYSVWRAPVLQYSMLIFSFPCILLAALHGLPRVAKRLAIPMIILLAGSGIHGLVAMRDHYHLFYNSKYEAFAETVVHGKANELIIMDAQPGIMDFYLKRERDHASRPYVNISSKIGQAAVDGILSSTPAVEVVLGITPSTLPELPTLVQEHFPHVLKVDHYCEGSVMRFSKIAAPTDAQDLRTLALPIWSDSTVTEYPAIVEADVRDMVHGHNDVIEIRAAFRAAPNDEILLAADLFEEGKSVIYRETRLKDAAPVRDGLGILHLTFRMSDYELRGRNLHFKAYVYNHTGRWSGVPEVSVRVRQGNPVVYGLYEPIGGR
ncbi:MAG: glycosyltransferase family 39 protein [Flavobacteriales bacterium]